MDEERWIYVACNCFRLGRTSPPPVALAGLTLDAVGDVVLIDQSRSEYSAGAFREWVQERACPHPNMREYETILDADWEYDHPLLAHYADEFKGADYPALKSVLNGPREGRVLMTPTVATVVLDELTQLWAHPLPGTTTVLIDDSGERVWPFMEPDGLDAGRGFTPLYCRPGVGTCRTDLLQQGVDGTDLVIRSTATNEELLRSSILEQVVGSDTIEVDHFTLRDVVYRDPATGASVRGFAEPIWRPSEYVPHWPNCECSHVRSARVARIPLTLAGTLSFPRLLQAAAEACSETSNPVALAGGPD